ncbi:Reverse transcriptase (RNA-dependent DNA polymerase) [Fragilaria crotonensis]|nr:Reverse transcriptase (RNA-dependent DNA polymerase) [Fragilaria crotonensis]
MKEVNRLKIRLKRSEAGRSNQNYAAEREIGELKKRWRNRMLKRKVPPRLWDYGLVYETNILNRIPRGQQQRTGIVLITGETPDISEWLDFQFYDRVWYYDQKKIEIDGSGRRLARWLGVAHRVGSDLCYWLLLESGKVIARTTVQHVVRDDYLNDDIRREIERFDQVVDEQLSDQNFMAEGHDGFYIQDELTDTVTCVAPVLDDVDDGDMPFPDSREADDIDDKLLDKYLNAELIFDVGTGSKRKGRVVKRAKGTSGEPIGRAHSNPLFDTREYVVEFTDGSTENYFANVIAECMYALVDSEGNQYQLLSEITDHRSDNSAIPVADGYVTSRNGNQRYWRTTHKFGIRVPKTVEEALAIDEETGTDFWRKALGKEMTKVKVAWKNMAGITPEQLIGILRWAIELGRLDIFVEVSQLSQHQALPRRGHLEALYHIFAYLKKHENGARIVFDPKTPDIDERVFNSNADWRDFYGDVQEEMPPNMPEPKGKSVTISCFVDANHAGNVITRRSHTGIIVYVQNAPIIWFSKRQNTVEASSFGSEFVALRTAKDIIVALRYKLRMFGVPIDGPANVFCDNNGVVKNTTIPESMLTKKQNAINYHVVREAVAARIRRWNDKSCRFIHEGIDCRSTSQFVSAHYVLKYALGYWSSVWAGPFTPCNGYDPWAHRYQVAEELV